MLSNYHLLDNAGYGISMFRPAQVYQKLCGTTYLHVPVTGGYTSACACHCCTLWCKASNCPNRHPQAEQEPAKALAGLVIESAILSEAAWAMVLAWLFLNCIRRHCRVRCLTPSH